MRFLVLSWNDVMRMSLDLATRIASDNWFPDAIVAILRGGYAIAKIVEDALGSPLLGTIEVKFYRGLGERSERPVITQPLQIDVRDKRVLVVDDVADSGRTLQLVSEIVGLYGAREVKTATLFFKRRSIVMPDYYVAETDAWVVFPWEICETVEQLVSKGRSVDEVVRMLSLDRLLDPDAIAKLAALVKRRVNKI